MNESATTRTMLVLADAHGRIVGMAPAADAASGAETTGIKPLPGQTLHAIEVPEAVLRLGSTNDVYQWARRHYIRGGAKPELRPITELYGSVPYFGHLG